ncbi:MAG TPA: HAD-IB family phosphatase [Thermoanaerobaculia bacterium]|jgi:phosphoserine phosphatase|nr:HAD-IB family phosphatase [Thermoanaerobaculia bacterium]
MTYRFAFFDVDSTLVTIEGIDVLADGNPEIATLTAAAMNGEIPLDQVYTKRLEMIRPSRQRVEQLAAEYLRSLVDGAQETVAALHDRGVVVHLITAGIEPAVLPVANVLKIAQRNVHAVKLTFDANGNYADFDRRSFLTRTGGKELVVRDIRARSHGKAALIGDGVSDLEAKPAVDLFIGFGGVVVRPRVKENAHLYVTDLRDVLQHLL